MSHLILILYTKCVWNVCDSTFVGCQLTVQFSAVISSMDGCKYSLFLLTGGASVACFTFKIPVLQQCFTCRDFIYEPQPDWHTYTSTDMHHHALYFWHTLTHRLSGGHSEWICVARWYRIAPSDRQIGLLCATWPAVTPSVLAQKDCTRYLTLHIVSLSLLFCVCVCECECWFYYCQTALHRGELGIFVVPWLIWVLNDLWGVSESGELIWSDKQKQFRCRYCFDGLPQTHFIFCESECVNVSADICVICIYAHPSSFPFSATCLGLEGNHATFSD